jgi:hypothetical protein
VGPWSFAKESQRITHDILNTDHPEGWDNQLHNEFGFVGTYERTWRWPHPANRAGLGWELLPHAGVALGNVATFANLGGELRAGWNLPDDFGTAAIGPSAVTSTPVDEDPGSARTGSGLGIHLFARADGRVVGHNIFIDGNTFGDSPSVGHKILVADLSVGLAVNYRNTELAFAIVDRTREFDGHTYLMERALVPDVSLVKAWKADQSGNLVFRRTARNFNPNVAMAGRLTIAEVEVIVPNGEIDPDAVHLPGIYVNRLVLNPSPEKRIEQRTTRPARQGAV